MTCKEAYFKTLWYKIPFEIRHAIEDAIVEGNFSIKMEKENSSSDKDELDDKIIPILNQLGYTVRSPSLIPVPPSQSHVLCK